MLTATLPDGRRLRARYEGPTGDWIVQVADSEDQPVSGRWLLVVLSELLDIPSGRKPAWVFDLVAQLAGRDTPGGRRYACPCCDFLTLTEPPTGTFAICPVCRWEDDNVQFVDLDRRDGANPVSLRDARENFRRHGVSDLARLHRVRAPLPAERP